MNLFRLHRQSDRAGIAPLEFVLALPLLFALFITLAWLGYSVIGQSEVLIEARNNAWKRRFENASDKPLHFSRLPTYDEKADYVTATASKKVEISPLFNSAPGPEASHMILAGSWDYEAMSFDEPPDVKLMAVAATVGTLGDAINWASLLDDPIGAFGRLGSGINRETQRESANVGKSDGSGSSTGNGTPEGETKTPEEAKAVTEAQRKADKAKLERRYQELGGKLDPFNNRVVARGGELERTSDEIDRLQRESNAKSTEAKSVPDDEKKLQLLEEAARLERKAEVARVKYKRLEAEVRDIVAELEALGVSRYELWIRP